MPTLIIAGGRYYKPIQSHVDVLNKVVKCMNIDKIITGECSGADPYGKIYAEHYHIEYEGFPANWDMFGKPAGPLRNMKMALIPGVVAVFLFPGNDGTKNMRDCAIKCKLEVFDTESQFPI